jgi:hypothetical protein
MAHRSIPKNLGRFDDICAHNTTVSGNLWTIGLSFRSSGLLISIEPLALLFFAGDRSRWLSKVEPRLTAVP